jgi:plasmid stabilization system protein ParE
MTFALKFSELAEDDIAGAMAWYTAIRPGLAVALKSRMDEALGRILDNPRAYPIVFLDGRRMRIRQFPYSIIFRIKENHVTVDAFLHVRKDPRSWRERIN